MIHEILEVFNERLEKNPNLVLNSYSLKEGLYIRLDNKVCEKFIVKSVKVETGKENILHKENGDRATFDDEVWFKKRDYLSTLWDINKAVFDKKFHSINYLTLFFKVENFDYISHNFTTYYDVFKSFSKFDKSKDREILAFHKTYIDNKTRQDNIAKIQNTVALNLENIKNVIDASELKKAYVKIFINEDLQDYENESKIYLNLKIFNDNSYNIAKDAKIYGLSNFNMGMNSKKPFFEHKSRKNIVPFLLTQTDAVAQKPLFDWLSFQNRMHIENFEKLHMVKFNKDGNAIISDFDYVPIKKNDFKFKTIAIRDFFNSNNAVIEIRSFDEFKVEVNKTLYKNSLFSNIFSEKISVSNFISKDLQALLHQTKDAMAEYFYKFNENDFLYVIKKYANDFIKIAFQDENYGKKNAKEVMNLIFSIRESKGDDMDLRGVIDGVFSALNSENVEKLDENEYCFLAGQVAMFLIRKSKAAKKTFALAEPYLKAKNTKKLKGVFKNDFDRYKHEIYIYDKKFNKAYLLLQNIQDLAIDGDMESMILAGMMSENLIYNKITQGDKDE